MCPQWTSRLHRADSRPSARCSRHRGGIGETVLPRGLGTSCWMDADKQRPYPIRALQLAFRQTLFLSVCSCFFSLFVQSFHFCPLSHFPIWYFPTVCGCHLDLVPSVTACFTIIIHFRVGEFFFFYFCISVSSAVHLAWKGQWKHMIY